MDIVFAGFGGQGVLTAGLIVGKIGVDFGKNVSWIPSYGSEMRGGTANCNLKISDHKIASPFIKNIDILIAMNAPSVAKFEPMVRSGGLIVSNKTLIADYVFRGDVTVVEVEATSLAEDAKNGRAANIVMLGALAASEELFDAAAMGAGIERFFVEKGKNNPKNAICFAAGVENCKTLGE